MDNVTTKLLLIRPGGLGDVILTYLLIQTLYIQIANLSISVVGYPRYWQIFKYVKLPTAGKKRLIDFIYDINRPEWGNLFIPAREISVPNLLIPYLKDTDLVLAYLNDSRGTIYHNLMSFGVKKVYSFLPFPDKKNTFHISQYYLSTLQDVFPTIKFTSPSPFVGRGDRGGEEELVFPESVSRKVDDIWRTYGLLGKHIFAIHPGSGNKKKNWPFTQYQKLIYRWITDLPDTKVILIFGPAERENPDFLPEQNLPVPIIIPTDIIELAVILSRVDLFLGNDSGVSHLAAWLGINTFVIFGPTNPEVWQPIGKKVNLVKPNVACAPCRKEVWDKCTFQKCLDTISVEEVYTQINRLVK